MIANCAWLCEILDLLLSPCPAGKTNNGLDHTIADNTPVWPVEMLQEEAKKRNIQWSEVLFLVLQLLLVHPVNLLLNIA